MNLGFRSLAFQRLFFDCWPSNNPILSSYPLSTIVGRSTIPFFNRSFWPSNNRFLLSDRWPSSDPFFFDRWPFNNPFCTIIVRSTIPFVRSLAIQRCHFYYRWPFNYPLLPSLTFHRSLFWDCCLPTIRIRRMSVKRSFFRIVGLPTIQFLRSLAGQRIFFVDCWPSNNLLHNH